MKKKNPLNSKMVYLSYYYGLDDDYNWIFRREWEEAPEEDPNYIRDDFPQFDIVLCGASFLNDEWEVAFRPKINLRPQPRSYPSEAIPGFRLCRTTKEQK